MSRILKSADGPTIWIKGDEHGIRIAIFGRDRSAHDIIALTPNEADKVRKAIDKAIDRAVIDIDELVCKGLADLNKEVKE